MPHKAVQWGKPHNKALQALFVSKEANPTRTELDYIDSFWDHAPENSMLLQISKERFRHHYKEKATQWMFEQALGGRRCCELP
jgi:hypothetical protein